MREQSQGNRIETGIRQTFQRLVRRLTCAFVAGRSADFAKDQKGITTLEFAMLAPVFIYLTMGILELSIMLFTSTVVDGAIHDAGRRIRTGQAQGSGDALSDFTAEVCRGVQWVYPCNEIIFDVRTYTNFSSVDVPIQVDENGNFVTEFNAGGSGQITAVRAIYEWQFFTPMIGQLFGDSENKRTLTMTTAFRNEVY